MAIGRKVGIAVAQGLGTVHQWNPLVGRVLLRSWGRALNLVTPRGNAAARKIVSPRYGFVCFLLPKVASNSFAWLFDTAMDPKLFHTEETLTQLSAHRPEVGDYFKFAFTRNPYERAGSFYQDKILNPRHSGLVAFMGRYGGLRVGMAFDDFARWLTSPEGSDEYADPHFRSQHLLISEGSNSTECDFVGKLEDAEEGLREIGRRLGIQDLASGALALPVRNTIANRSRVPTTTPDQLYAEESRRLVRERYAQDFELLGYSPTP